MLIGSGTWSEGGYAEELHVQQEGFYRISGVGRDLTLHLLDILHTRLALQWPSYVQWEYLTVNPLCCGASDMLKPCSEPTVPATDKGLQVRQLNMVCALAHEKRRQYLASVQWSHGTRVNSRNTRVLKKKAMSQGT